MRDYIRKNSVNKVSILILNCHLEIETKIFGAVFGAIFSRRILVENVPDYYSG